MSGIETNIFPLLNLEKLSSKYKLYEIKGLNQESSKNKDEIYKKVNSLVTKLSYQLQIPVTYIQEDKKFFIVVRDDAKEPPKSVDVPRGRLFLEQFGETFDLNYTNRSPNSDRIAIKFLQFLLREPLGRDSRLWSPGAGRPFFDLEPFPITDEISQYTGFKPRVVSTHDGGLGVCVDITHKYTGSNPLPAHLARTQFYNRYKNRHLIYRFGHQWFEIKAEYSDQLNVSESTIDTEDGLMTTIDFINSRTKKPFPEDLLNLPTDASVIGYFNNRGEDRKAPAALCYQVYGSHDRVMKDHHQKSALKPDKRRNLIHEYVQTHLKNLRFGDTDLEISDKPLNAPARKFVVPDYEYGNSQILSVRSTKDSQHVSLDNLGRTRLSMLKDGPGFFDSRPLDYHYLILPYTVANSYGENFTDDLKAIVDRFFPQETGFDPQVVVYDDRGEKIWAVQAAAVKTAVEKHCQKPGFAVVMIHDTENRNLRDEDTLAAAVMTELHKSNIYSTIIHTNFTRKCYKFGRGKDGNPYCTVRHGQHNRLSGYLQGVALNKVLLNDFRTPFRLSTKLHADLTIGVDVKNHTAGFVIVGKKGGNVRFDWDFEQSEKEKISYKRMKKCVKKILNKEMDYLQDVFQNVVFQRDGRFYQSEIDAIEDGVSELKKIGAIPEDLGITLIEIHKKSEAPFRLFEVTEKDFGKDEVWNPQVGYYYISNELDGYVCSTGRAFFTHRKGTVNPLHVKYIKGDLEFEKCLEDVYFLTTLTWTNPRDCLREPITIKLTDRYLNEEAGNYDANDLIDAFQALQEEVYV